MHTQAKVEYLKPFESLSGVGSPLFARVSLPLMSFSLQDSRFDASANNPGTLSFLGSFHTVRRRGFKLARSAWIALIGTFLPWESNH